MTSITSTFPSLPLGRLLGRIGLRAAGPKPARRSAPDLCDAMDPFAFDAPPMVMGAFDDCLKRSA